MDEGVEEELVEVGFEVVVYVVGVGEGGVIDGEEEWVDLEWGVEVGVDDFDGVEEFGDGLEWKVLGV